MVEAATEASSKADPIAFVLERLPHIRCFSLSACGARGAYLMHAEASARGSVVALTCWLLGGESGSGELHECCLRLDLGELLDNRPEAAALICTVSDGYAYVRLPLAPEAARTAGRAQPPIGEPSSDAALATDADPGADAAALDDGRVSQQLREEAGLYYRAAVQRRRERASLRRAALSCRRCGEEGAGAPLLVVGAARALPDVDVSSLVDFMQVHTRPTCPARECRQHVTRSPLTIATDERRLRGWPH